MKICVLIILLTIIDYIIHRICVHFEFKSNERLFFIIYYDLLKGDIAKEIKKDPFFYESLFYSDISEGGDKNV